MELKFNAFYWSSYGPFFVQTSRLLHYFVYFVVGIGIGAYGINRSLLAADGKLDLGWWLWMTVAIIAFMVNTGIGLTAMRSPSSPRAWEAAAAFTYTLACAASGLFFLALFTKLMQRRSAIWDSLSSNAYGMYLIHYPVVVWLQFALLAVAPSPITKGAIVSVGAVALSWGIVVALRRVPAIARVL